MGDLETQVHYFPPGPPGRPVITCDPGLMTGFAVMEPDGAVWAGEAAWDEGMVWCHTQLARLSAAGTAPLLVCEAFVITIETAKHSAAPWSTEALGVLRYLSRRYGVEYRTPQAGPVKKVASNARLKVAGWYHSTPGGHTNDGLRHLYYALVEDRRLVPPPGVR